LFGPTRVLDPNGISIGSAIFAGFTTVTNRQTMLLSTGNNNIDVKLTNNRSRVCAEASAPIYRWRN